MFKGVSLPVNTLVIISIAVVVLLAFFPLISEEMKQLELLKLENILRPQLREGFNKWVDAVLDKVEIRTGSRNLDDATSHEIWDTYSDVQVDFMGGKVGLWRICWFGFQKKGEDFSFMNCWNYGMEHFSSQYDPEKYKLVRFECSGCNKDRHNYEGETPHRFKKDASSLSSSNLPWRGIECQYRKNSDTQLICWDKRLSPESVLR